MTSGSLSLFDDEFARLRKHTLDEQQVEPLKQGRQSALYELSVGKVRPDDSLCHSRSSK